MKYSKKYVVFTALLIVLIFWKLNTWSDEYGEVETFRGAQLEEEVFYPLKAANINDMKLLKVTLDGVPYGNGGLDLCVNDRMQPSASLEFLRDEWDCSARMDGEGKILIERNKVRYSFSEGTTEGTCNHLPYSLSSPPFITDGRCYLPMEDLCRMFSFAYQWDAAQYVVAVTGMAENPSVLPKAFDLRDRNRVAPGRNQGSAATCWAYASLGALESSLLPGETASYSTEHMTTHNGFGLDISAGGDYTMAAAYLLSWQGPVKKGNTAAKHVQEVHFYSEDELDDIKWAVYCHGGVSTSVYANVTNSNLSKSSYYNKRTNAYCYMGNHQPNHDVVIIGWDDDYSARNFAGDVPGNGAFICQNSWGSDFGDKGVFYISYYDTNIGAQSVSYVSIEDVDNYDTIYQSDLCGWVGQVGFNKSKIQAANVYRAAGTEEICAAGFYTLGKNTKYQIYMVPDFDGPRTLASRQLMAAGTLEDAGYYTVDFDKPYRIEGGREFAVVIALETPGEKRPMAIEYRADEMTKHVDVSDGEGYISNNGLEWERVEETAEGNLCLKAYGRKVSEE